MPVLAALGIAVGLMLVVLTRIQVRTDMMAFLPAGETAGARLVLQEARAGAATGLILWALMVRRLQTWHGSAARWLRRCSGLGCSPWWRVATPRFPRSRPTCCLRGGICCRR